MHARLHLRRVPARQNLDNAIVEGSGFYRPHKAEGNSLAYSWRECCYIPIKGNFLGTPCVYVCTTTYTDRGFSNGKTVRGDINPPGAQWWEFPRDTADGEFVGIQSTELVC